MRVAVIGAGAIGSLFGGLLTEAGAEVCLLDVWQEHVDSINERGLSIEREGVARTVRVPATVDLGRVPSVDLIMVLVKTTSTGAAAETARDLSGPESLVLTLQNGLGNAEVIAGSVGPTRVLAGATSHGATVLGPGKIRHAGTGSTIIGMWASGEHHRAVEIAEFLSEAGIVTRADEDVRSILWDKLLVTAGINAITALTGIRNGGLLECTTTRDLVQAAVEEAVTVARAVGVQVPEDPVGHVVEVIRATAQNRSSMAQDVRHRRQTEIEAINGAVVREAQKLGIEVPVNHALTALVKTVQAGF
jgi:2-dehydropantoate 2-reductase